MSKGFLIIQGFVEGRYRKHYRIAVFIHANPVVLKVFSPQTMLDVCSFITGSADWISSLIHILYSFMKLPLP